MKKALVIAPLTAILFLCSCSAKTVTEQYEFPKTTWSMSVQETLDAYGVTKEDTRLYNETGRGASFILEDYELFGEVSSRIQFNYIDFADNGNYELCRVRITYPKDADMNQVLEKMQKIYGETTPEITVYSSFSTLGNETLSSQRYVESEQIRAWAGKTVHEVVSEDEAENYIQNWEFFQDGLTEENWEEFSQDAKMVYAIWLADEVANTIEFNAYNLCVYNELNSQLSN